MSTRLAHGLLILITFILTAHFLREASGIVLPFLTAAVLSFFAHPITKMMVKRRLPVWLAIASVLFVIVLLLAAFGFLVHLSINGVVDNAPRYERHLSELWGDLVDKIGVSKHTANVNIGTEVKKQSASMVGVFGGIVGSLLAFVESLALVLVYLVFFLWGRESLPKMLDRAFGPQKGQKMMVILRDVEEQSLRYIGLRTLLCIATGVVAWIVLELYGVEFAPLFGVMTFAAQFVPFIGPITASVAPILIAVVQFDSPLTAVAIGLWLMGWHFLVGYFVEPRVFGRSMHLSQPLLLFGLLFFAWLWGAAGAVLAVPLLVVAKSVFDHVPLLRPAGVILGGETSPP